VIEHDVRMDPIPGRIFGPSFAVSYGASTEDLCVIGLPTGNWCGSLTQPLAERPKTGFALRLGYHVSFMVVLWAPCWAQYT